MGLQESMLRKVIEGVSNTHGDDFFSAISLQLADIIQADYVFIARLDRAAYESHTISMVIKGQPAANMTYSLAYTPCADVSNDTVCCYPSGVCGVYPNDQLLKDLHIEAYLGTPLRNSRGEVMGLIVAMHEQPITDPSLVLTLFEIFSGRIAAEIERREYEQSLEAANQQLEVRIAERTADLQTAMERLQATRQQLVESEKMAALGNLVAGVSHEVNTPLGVSITAHSVMQLAVKKLCDAVHTGELTEEQMAHFLADMDEALALQQHNLLRARDLLDNFKRTAVDQHVLEVEEIDLAAYYQQVLTTLQPLLKSAHAEVSLEASSPIRVRTYPGCHAQILTNLVSNSVLHGFAGRQTGNRLTLTLCAGPDGQAEVLYRDNGCGLSEEGKQHLFEPFYTTSRQHGGTGLGMSIVYNLVTQRLKGEIALQPSEQGFALRYTLQPAA